jgi:hypothetical protein
MASYVSVYQSDTGDLGMHHSTTLDPKIVQSVPAVWRMCT